MNAVARALSLLLVAALAACQTTTRYRAPLVGNPTAGATQGCVNACRAHYPERDAYLECFAACPGVEVEEEAQCRAAEVRDGVAVCEQKEQPAQGRSVLVGLGLVVGAMGLVVVAAGSIATSDCFTLPGPGEGQGEGC